MEIRQKKQKEPHLIENNYIGRYNVLTKGRSA